MKPSLADKAEALVAAGLMLATITAALYFGWWMFLS